VIFSPKKIGTSFVSLRFTNRFLFLFKLFCVVRNQAYLDRPFKKGPVHISAPHMYVTVLEALELKPGNAFLNVGSGTGYLCCLAWNILGDIGLTHGIEISHRMVEYSKGNIKKFEAKKQHILGKFDAEPISIVHGNCFDIDVYSSVASCKYDRIYVGAGCPESRKQFFYDLLADGGILVLPVDEKNQMMKVRKVAGTIYSVSHVSNVHFAPLIEADIMDNADGNTGSEMNFPSSLTPLEVILGQADVSSLFIHHSMPKRFTFYIFQFFFSSFFSF
jgi:protein-L-isoaspartate(D-aspartate) O-methyltransferase